MAQNSHTKFMLYTEIPRNICHFQTRRFPNWTYSKADECRCAFISFLLTSFGTPKMHDWFARLLNCQLYSWTGKEKEDVISMNTFYYFFCVCVCESLRSFECATFYYWFLGLRKKFPGLKRRTFWLIFQQKTSTLCFT